ncbi:MAG: 4-hydroxythreonine-4-phosphate dehydrogenase PdxA [Bacteroidaceae bacterium]|nr:4-hydroxythreonine-4-phosphate dehydrogenase PdxA [Bacteroidaceae bacterium]
MRKLKVAITHGDPNGVGYEVILKTFADPGMFEICTPIIYGSPKVAAYHRKVLDLQVPFQTVVRPSEARDGELSLIPCTADEVKLDLGQPTAEGGRAAFDALERALADWRAGDVDVLVTAPINKNNIQNDNFHFPGHTEYIQSRTEAPEGSALMILMNERVRVALATTHLPLRRVADAITGDVLLQKLRIFNTTLQRDFSLSMPRIAVLALNPHAGDGGVLGTEEQEVIQPAIDEANAEGIHAFGPFPADGFFGSRAYDHFDGILAMYHDQGLAPFKLLADGDGVNFTAGLDIIRTSPAHGTAFDIAGRGQADEKSFRHAIYTAIDVWRSRMAWGEAHANPLPKLYIDKRDKSERL